ncbi:MAG: hypothetical protein IJM34_04750 [Lachnospiraceae bacterium]|nr:hypothetical protein [Lachnospiraceae bacterium]
MGSLYEDKEKNKEQGSVFNVTDSRNTDIQEELERRKRREEETRKWMMNAPGQTQKRFEDFNKDKKKQKPSHGVLPSKEAAEEKLKKDYIKLTVPTFPWDAAKYPDMPQEMQDLIRDILADNSRMTMSHFGKLKAATEALASAESAEMKEVRLEQLLLSCREYLEKSTRGTKKKRVERCKKLTAHIVEYQKKREKEREAFDKNMAGGDKDAQEITRCMDALRALKTDRIRPYPAGGSEKELRDYRKEINGMGMFFSMQYNKLIDACDKFLSKKDKSIDSRLHYESVKKYYMSEHKIFNNALTDFLSEHGTRGDITWGEAVLSRSGAAYFFDTKKTKNAGAGTSNVFKIKRGSTGFDYFKKEENIGGSVLECWETTAKEFLTDESLTDEQRQTIARLHMAMLTDLKTEGLNEKKKKQKEEMLYHFFVRGFYRQEDFFTRIEADEEREDKNLKKYMPKTALESIKQMKSIAAVKPQDLLLINKVLAVFARSFNSYTMATDSAKIKAGSNLSSRNVATYRMAVALGIEGNVARSETAKVMVDGKEVYGNLVEEAKGREAHETAKNVMAYYTDRCICNMADMQIFDFICGQIDRNTKNYYTSLDKDENIYDLKMIDNDLCFGKLKPSELEKGRGRLPAFNIAVINVLTDGFKKRILEMDEKTISVLLGDILSEEEIKAAAERLGYVKGKIRLAQKQSKLRKNSADENERFEEYCMGFEEYRVLIYQKALHKRLSDDWKDNYDNYAEGQQNAKPAWNSNTYLLEQNLPSEEIVENKIYSFREKKRREYKNA